MSSSDEDGAAKSERERRRQELLSEMSEAKRRWDAEAASDPDGPDEADALLSQAIELAIAQGGGWKPGEREAYVARITDDEYVPPLFAESVEEVEKSGLAEAFEALRYDDPPVTMMLEAKRKGNEAFAAGKKNVAKNAQYYRDAVNHYYEALFFADRVVPLEPGDEPGEDEEGPFYFEEELDGMKSTLRSNAAMAHLMLRNWGHVRDDAAKAVEHDRTNVKAWYRLAKAYAMLKDWEGAGDAIESGLKAAAADDDGGESAAAAGVKELKKLQTQLDAKIRSARRERQRRERARAERVKLVKDMWRYCSDSGIRLGRVPLVSAADDDDDDDEENRWHHHHPHTGCLPSRNIEGDMTWPTMFLYPSHRQSDFVERLAEGDMLAYRMAEMFPELEDTDSKETNIIWDHSNQFVCSKLAVYFEALCSDDDSENEAVVHPDSVELLRTQGDAMRFYESSRALRGDEGPEMSNVTRCAERVRLSRQRKAWIKRHGSVWNKPDPCPVVRVHPAVTLGEVLRDGRMVVPNFLVTFLIFPEDHPAHKAFLKERKCLGVLQPKDLEGGQGG